ncbi:hypothetical protein [Nocardia cerradoensis]|uniref:RNA polymerase sigma factor 70 region 4 type 2 domain-containing protein n=1 Tax=Nocardia cerradoensis TaxID=85688 RepID=A0A231GT58_9NOCA|nr:hypothetical protein [Nocardia cerradoensis]NKY47967.1 hypothetical protein [Nocardia cerradoensis]OXR39813.1 hypothetical protein B7C42_08101 [Nocardia cerradoensis]
MATDRTPDSRADALLEQLRTASAELEETTRRLTERRNRIIVQLCEMQPLLSRKAIADAADLSENMVYTVFRKDKERRGTAKKD